MRLFIALGLTPGLIKKIAYLEEKIEKKLNLKIPWIPLKNLHLTILFLGHLSYENYLKISEIFDELKFTPIDLKITKIDFGPPGRKRMIWLYLEKNKKLEEIKKFFEEELEKRNIAYKREAREFLPHINLVRLKTKINQDIKETLNWQIRLNEISLYESILKKEGAEYEKLKTIKV